MKTLGYVRCSTPEQKTDRQTMQLFELCDQVYEDQGLSGKSLKNREAYHQLMADIQPGDVFVITSVDRAFRSSLDALSELKKLHERSVTIRILALNMDTRKPDGKLIYGIMALAAEYERDILSLRTKEGLAAARLSGKRLGRPPKLSAKQVTWARRCLAANTQTMAELSRHLEVSPRTIKRAISAN